MNGIVLNPLGAQGMNSTSQWVATAFGWLAALMATDRLSGGMFVLLPFIESTLAPLDLSPAPTSAPPGCAMTPATAAGTPDTPPPSCR